MATNLKPSLVTPSALVTAYTLIRSERAELAKQEQALKIKQDLLGEMLMAKMQELGTTAFTASGFTVYQSTLVTASVKDREAFLQFVRSNDLYELMDIRASKEAVQNWANDNPIGTTPEGMPVPATVPGVELNALARINVRKAG